MKQKLKTIATKTKVSQSLDTDTLNVVFTHERIEGEAPAMVVAKATPKDSKLPYVIDLVYYPQSSNMQITIHNKPKVFDLKLLEDIIEGINEVIEG